MRQATLNNDWDTYVPETCVGFTIESDYAHFRRVGNNSAKPTYRIPPRTTIAGLLAGIMGYGRDTYYDLFQPDNSAVSVVPLNNPHTITLSTTTVNTKADEAIKYVPTDVDHYSHGVKALTPESYVELDRQRDPYEMLVDPAYRIYVGLDDDDVEAELLHRLETSQYHYSPSLGLSECLASITDVEQHNVEGPTSADQPTAVDSVVYTGEDSVVVPEPGLNVRRERSPLYMEALDKGGRRTTSYANVTYVTEPEKTASVKDHRVSETDRHTVCFS